MKLKSIRARISGFTRILYHGTLVTLALLFVGLLAALVSAEPASSAPLHFLPTRPPGSRPTPKPSEPGPAPTSEPSPQLPRPTPSPTPPSIPSVDLTFEELGHPTFQLSDSGSRGVELYLPHNFVPIYAGSYLDLLISHTPPEPDKLSVIRVTLNDAPLAVITLSPENTEPTHYRFYLGSTPLTPGRNEIHIALDAGAACNVRGARVDVSIYGSSSFHLEYSLTRLTPDLALYPIPFFERSFEHEPVYVVLPENPSVADLSAAATIAAGLGKFSDGEIRLASTLDTQIPADVRNNYHLIVVGKRGSNRLLDQLNLPSQLDDPTLSDEQGVIQELVSPWNPLRMLLVVAGGSDEGLYKASQALNREVHLLGMRDSVAIVQTVLPPEPAENRQFDVDFTLDDLGHEEEVVYGTRPHVLEYSFDVPLSCACTEEARFTLYFDHAGVADPSSSVLDVQFNDVPLHSTFLDESNASEGMLELSLPSWLIRSGRNEIRISVEMNLASGDKCLFLDAEHVWTTIYGYSNFHLPFTAREVKPSLDLFPYPFSQRPSLSGLLLVLADRPGQLDYDLMLEVAAGLGAADQGDSLALSVTTADLVTQDNRQDKDLVLVGRPSAHSLIEELNDDLPQPFEPRSDQLRSQVESVVFVQDPSWDIGLIEELAAPWDAERTILVLTGTTDEGVALAGTTLFSGSDALAGNVLLVEESLGVRALDTRFLLSPPGSGEADASRALLIQLSEKWW